PYSFLPPSGQGNPVPGGTGRAAPPDSKRGGRNGHLPAVLLFHAGRRFSSCPLSFKGYPCPGRLIPVIVDHIKKGIADAGGNVASPFSAPGYNIGDVCLHDQLLRRDHIDKAYRCPDDELWRKLFLLDQLIKAN